MALINLRNALMSGKRTPTAKDYVQNGLVAMWDGIENAGWGTHDASATTWKDLIGDNDFTITPNGIWGADNINNGTNYNQIAYRNDFNLLDAPLTQEVVMQYLGRQNTQNTLVLHISQWHEGNSMRRGLMVIGGQYFKFATATNNSMLVNVPTTSTPISLVSTYSTNPNIINGVFVNGSSSSLVAGLADSWFYSDATGVCIGNRASNNRGTNIKVHRIAFYSRALTASEIAANYAIDKARFNLP